MMKKLLFFLSLMVIGGHCYSATVTFDQLAVSDDLTVAKYNADLDALHREFNSNIESSNIANDTLAEADFADDSNPRIRTFEGAACEKVDDGLLPVESVGTLSSAIPTGTAYPRGFRCDKTSNTSRTWTASRWTFLDIDQNCDFQFQEVAIDAAAPAVSANSIRIARVSTDGTQVSNVQDLRTTSCATGPFDNIVDTTSEASLDDVFRWGRPVRNRGTNGWLQGLEISYDTVTQFIVRSGSAFINGKFRIISVDTTVPQTADNPAQGTSGLDTGAIAADTRYNVFALADQDTVKTLSISFGTGSTPSGGTNYRKIGEIRTESGSSFMSKDIIVTHGIHAPSELVSSWVVWDGVTAGAPIRNSFNVSSITDGGVGIFTVVFDKDYISNDYVVTGSCGAGGSVKTVINYVASGTGSLRVNCNQVGDVLTDNVYNAVQVVGEIQE